MQGKFISATTFHFSTLIFNFSALHFPNPKFFETKAEYSFEILSHICLLVQKMIQKIVIHIYIFNYSFENYMFWRFKH